MTIVCIPRKSKDRNRDLISELPDEILIKILLKLSFREATRTAVLAHRWRDLTAAVSDWPDLDFSSPELLASLRPLNRSNREATAAEFAASVDRAVRAHPAKKGLDEFTVRFELNQRFSDAIDRWIGAASRKGAGRLSLEFPTPWETHRARSPYQFPRLAGLCPDGFGSLVELTLGFVVFRDENTVKYFLDSCLLLESLRVKKSAGIEDTVTIDRSPRLKTLSFLDCTDVRLVRLESAPNLVRFEYSGSMVASPVVNEKIHETPLLSEAFMGDDHVHSLSYCSREMSPYLSQLTKLKLEVKIQGFCIVHEYLPSNLPMMNLLELELEVEAYNTYSFLWTTLLVGSAPNLHRFSKLISLMADAPRRWHLKLKTIEMYGFTNSSYQIELLKRLIRNSLEREKVIVIDVCNPFLEAKPWRAVSATKLNKMRKLAKKLKEIMPPNVRIVIL